MDIGTDPILEVRVHDGASMDECLNAAVDGMIEVALQGCRRGIRVARLGAGHFIVGLSDAVPFGRTEECDAWNRSS